MGLLSQQYGKVVELTAGSTLCTPTIRANSDNASGCVRFGNICVGSENLYNTIQSCTNLHFRAAGNCPIIIGDSGSTHTKVCNTLCTPTVCAASCLRSSGNTYSDNYLVDAGDGNGIRFWNGSQSYKIYMSSTGGSGAGELWSQGDYNMYFKMLGNNGSGTSYQRGFVWQEDDGSGNTQNLAHLNHQGLRFASTSCGFICSCTGCIKYPIYAARYSNGNNNYRGLFCWNKLQLGNNGVNQIIAGDEAGGGRFEFVVNNCADATANPNGTTAMVMCQGGGVYGCVCLQSPRICGTSCLRGATVCATGQARVCSICTVGDVCNTIAGQLSVNCLCSTTSMTRSFPTWSIMGTRYLPQVNASANLPVGWHTIFINTGSRAGGRFVLRDTTGSRHQYVVFYATHMYGEGNSINVLSYSRYINQPMQCIRIKDSSTYDGAALQVYVCDATNNLVAYEAGDNIHSSGWYFLNSWCCDACVPYSTSCFNACWPAGCYCTSASVNLQCIQDGGQILTGKLYAPVICGTSCVQSAAICGTTCVRTACVHSTGNICGTEICSGSWFRNANSGQGLYNTGTGFHFYSTATNNVRFYSGQANNIGLQGFSCGAGRGCLHFNCDNQIHIYDSGGNARILVNSSTDIRLCNTTCVYGNIVGGRICSTATGSCAIVSAGGICVTSDWYRITGNNGLYFSSHTAGIHGGGTGVVCAYNNGRFCSNATTNWGLRSAGCILAVSCMQANCNVCAGCDLVSGNATCVGEWVRFGSATRGLYWSGNCSLHLYPACSNTPYMHLRSCHSNTALVITTSDNTTARGYLYGNSSNNIGILDSNGNWAIRHVASSCTDFRIGNSVKMNLYTGCLCHCGIICAASCLRAPTVCATGCVTAPNVYSNGANVTNMAQGCCKWRQFMVCGDADTFYPVCYFRGYTFGYKRYSINRSYNSTAPNTWYTSTHKGGLNYTWEQTSDTQWGGNDRSFRVNQVREIYTTVIGGHVHTVSGGIVLLRGGGALYCYASDAMCNSCVCVYDGTGGTDSQGMPHSTCTYFCPGNCACVCALTCANAQTCRNSTICNTSAYPLQMQGVGNGSATTGCFCVVRSAGHLCAADSVCGPYIIGSTCARAPYVLATNCVHACCGITFTHSNWSGEKTKIQAHSCHLYFQNYNTGCFFFRNCAGSNILHLNCAGCLYVNNCIKAASNICSCLGITGSSYLRTPGYLQTGNHIYAWSQTQNCITFGVGNAAGNGWIHPLKVCRCGSVVIDGADRNSSLDTALLIWQCSNSDWAMRVCKNVGTATEYGIKVEMGASATYGYDAIFGGVRKFTVSYNRVCHNQNVCAGSCVVAPRVCGSTCVRGGVVCATSGFYGDGSNLTGISAGGSLCGSTGSANGSCTTLGYCALPSGTGTGNVAIGFKAMQATTSGFFNTASGYRVMCCNTTGHNNTAFGMQALFKNTTGFRNTAVGVSALYNNTASSNTAVGGCAMQQTTTGGQNTAVGVGALYATTSASSNTSSGYQSAYATTTGQQNTSMGAKSLRINTTGGQNVALGYYAMYSNTGGSTNVAIGCGALYGNTTGGNNIGIGKHAGCANTTACNRTYIGNASTTNTYICGALSKSSGCFNIPHPDPAKREKYDLVHSFVESPTEGDNIYRWTTETTNCRSVIELPDYYRYLNKNDQVWISPNRHFGNAYGEVTEDQKCLIVCSETDGNYNVLLIGTRKDAAVQSWEGPEVLAEKKYKE